MSCRCGEGKLQEYPSAEGRGWREINEKVIARGLGQMVTHTVSSAFLVPVNELQAPTRCRARVARARQVAMYLAHVGLGLSYTDAGRLFGRDRTTVAHACRLVEEQREDPRFDASLDYLEQTLRARLGAGVGAARA